jgi:hypothetical protein
MGEAWTPNPALPAAPPRLPRYLRSSVPALTLVPNPIRTLNQETNLTETETPTNALTVPEITLSDI